MTSAPRPAAPVATRPSAVGLDRLRLLGVLLAKVELEITAATTLDEEEELDDVVGGPGG